MINWLRVKLKPFINEYYKKNFSFLLLIFFCILLLKLFMLSKILCGEIQGISKAEYLWKIISFIVFGFVIYGFEKRKPWIKWAVLSAALFSLIVRVIFVYSQPFSVSNHIVNPLLFLITICLLYALAVIVPQEIEEE